jgi:glycosyltransferase involved in cell wall biosynthesis
MRLIYFHTYGGDINNGVNKKIFAQSSQLYQLGIDFSLVLLGGINNNYPHHNFIHYLSLKECSFLKIMIFTRFCRQYFAKQYIKKVIKFSGSGTILYLRYPLPILLLPHELITDRKCKIILECNSIETNEQKKSRSYFPYYKELFFGQEFRKHCDGIVGVTDEITHYQIKRLGNFNKPHITIGNGFEVDSVQIRQPPPYTSLTINVISVSTVSSWHGLDRLIQGTAEYNGPIKIKIHIVGDGPEVPHLKKMIDDLKINDHIVFHGFTTGKDLDQIFDQCHIAIGSLGLHRIGLKEASILKAREYCSRGIPYITACNDPDFSDDFAFLLKVPSDDSSIDMEKVLAFTYHVFHVTDHPQKMRQYARENLDWSVKMKKLKGFLEELVKEDRSN